MLQFLASVEHDTDGKFTRIFRVDVPSYMRDDESMIFALEHDQINDTIYDPTEWFTVPVDLHDKVRAVMGYNVRYCTAPGNIFDA